jgi:hypothetical protein
MNLSLFHAAVPALILSAILCLILALHYLIRFFFPDASESLTIHFKASLSLFSMHIVTAHVIFVWRKRNQSLQYGIQFQAVIVEYQEDPTKDMFQVRHEKLAKIFYSVSFCDSCDSPRCWHLGICFWCGFGFGFLAVNSFKLVYLLKEISSVSMCNVHYRTFFILHIFR